VPHVTTSDRDPRRLIVFAVLVSLAGILLLLLLYQVRSTLLLVYVCGLFAMGLSPIVRMIERQRVVPIGTRRLPRWLAILIIYGTVLGLIAVVAAVAIPPLMEQSEELWRAMPDRLDKLQAWLVRVGILRRPVTLGEAVQQTPAGGGATVVSTVLGAIRNLVGGVFGLIALLILTFYMLVESREIFSFFVKLFPADHRSRVSAVIAAAATKVSAWLGGQLVLAVVIGLTSAIGLGLMRVPYFFVLALISAVGEMIPMVGPVLAAIPAILVAVTVSPGLALGVTIFFIIQQQLENHILVPKVMSRQVGLSAVTVIISLGIGAELLGIVGAILSVPTAAIVQVVFQELMSRDE
jgi:predicted PurR-regulated permease PerM